VITGGEYTITAEADGLEANDTILISDGTLTIESGKDALHCETPTIPLWATSSSKMAR